MSRISPSDINGEEFLNEFLARTLLSRNAVSPLPLLLLYSRGGPTITRPIRERTRGVRVQAEPVTTDVVGPIVPEKDSESGLGANDVGDQPLPSRTTFNLRLFRARPRMTHGVPLFLESRARFYLESPLTQPSSRSLRPCGLGRLRVCYLAAAPLSNLQHRDACVQPRTRVSSPRSKRAELRSLRIVSPAVKDDVEPHS